MSALRHKQSFPRSRPRMRAVEIQNVMRAFGQTIERIVLIGVGSRRRSAS